MDRFERYLQHWGGFIVPRINIFPWGENISIDNIVVIPDSFGSRGDWGHGILSWTPSLPVLLAIYIAADKLAENGNMWAAEFMKGVHNELPDDEARYRSRYITGTLQIGKTILHIDTLAAYDCSVEPPIITAPLADVWEKHSKFCQSLTGQKEPSKIIAVAQKYGRVPFLRIPEESFQQRIKDRESNIQVPLSAHLGTYRSTPHDNRLLIELDDFGGHTLHVGKRHFIENAYTPTIMGEVLDAVKESKSFRYDQTTYIAVKDKCIEIRGR